MRLPENDEVQVLTEAAKNVIKTVPKLPDITCSMQKKDGWVRRVTWCVSCHCSVPATQWEEHTDCQPHFHWQGCELSYTAQVVWRGQADVELTVTFHRRSAREWEGLRTAGLGGDLQDWKRRAARRQQHEKTLIIAVNRPLRLPQPVAARVQARGPTAFVPSGTPDEFNDKIIALFRTYEKERLAAWKMGRRRPPSYGHPILWVNTRTTHKEVIFYLGLYLAQADMIDEATIQSHLVTRFHVPSALVLDVWKGVKHNFAYPQSPAGQHDYITQVIKDIARRTARRHARTRRAETGCKEKRELDIEDYEGEKEPENWISRLWDKAIIEEYVREEEPATDTTPASQPGVFSDQETGEEYWTIQRTAMELKVDETTVRRWIRKKGLHTKSLSSRRRSGVQKPVTTVLRGDVECLKAHVEREKEIIGLLAKSRQITKASAQRAYTRLHERLQKRLGREPTPEDILQALHDDLKVVAYYQRQRAGKLSGKAR